MLREKGAAVSSSPAPEVEFMLILEQITRLSKVIHVTQLAQKDLDDPSQ
jgi:hypothetical protein